MYIYQNGKLYIQSGNKIVGVEIYPDKIIKVAGTDTVKEPNAMILTAYEVRCKFHTDMEPYIFPVEKKTTKAEVKEEVVKNDTSGKTSKTNRK